MKTYRDLIAWQRSMDLVQFCYAFSRRLPASQRYVLTSQIQRAAISIPANIAEEFGRTGPREYLHHISIARGSLRELETLLLIAERLGYASPAVTSPVVATLDEVGRLLHGLTRSLSGRAES